MFRFFIPLFAAMSIATMGITAMATGLTVPTARAADSSPFIIAHRGASGYLPEHTLEAVALAHGLGADYIEQDVVLTRDDVPIVLHDIHLDTVTDVATRFPDRKRADGRYYAIDFDWAEIKTLTVHERINRKTGEAAFKGRFPLGVGTFRIPSLDEEIALIKGLNRSAGRTVGIAPEIKAPHFHRAAGKDISRIVIAALAGHGYAQASDPVIVQCFNWPEVRRMRKELGYDGRLLQLLGENNWEIAPDTDYDVLKSPAGLKTVAEIADAVGPWIGQIGGSPRDENPAFTSLVSDAKAAGLQVIPYTFRSDRMPRWAPSYADLVKMIILDRGADGLFTDFPDTTLRILEAAR